VPVPWPLAARGQLALARRAPAIRSQERHPALGPALEPGRVPQRALALPPPLPQPLGPQP